jgi:hypothetical protein
VISASISGAACTSGSGESAAPGVIPFAITPAKTLASSPELVALGKKTFEKECVACHGAAGNGEGDASYLLYPRPRDFTSGQFRIISTWEGVPANEDLFRAISRGMPSCRIERSHYGFFAVRMATVTSQWTSDCARPHRASRASHCDAPGY